MYDGILDQIVRAKGPGDIRPEALKAWQQHLRDTIDPMVGEVAALREENAALKRQLQAGKQVGARS